MRKGLLATARENKRKAVLEKTENGTQGERIDEDGMRNAMFLADEFRKFQVKKTVVKFWIGSIRESKRMSIAFDAWKRYVQVEKCFRVIQETNLRKIWRQWKVQWVLLRVEQLREKKLLAKSLQGLKTSLQRRFRLEIIARDFAEKRMLDDVGSKFSRWKHFYLHERINRLRLLRMIQLSFQALRQNWAEGNRMTLIADQFFQKRLFQGFGVKCWTSWRVYVHNLKSDRAKVSRFFTIFKEFHIDFQRRKTALLNCFNATQCRKAIRILRCHAFEKSSFLRLKAAAKRQQTERIFISGLQSILDRQELALSLTQWRSLVSQMRNMELERKRQIFVLWRSRTSLNQFVLLGRRVKLQNHFTALKRGCDESKRFKLRRSLWKLNRYAMSRQNGYSQRVELKEKSRWFELYMSFRKVQSRIHEAKSRRQLRETMRLVFWFRRWRTIVNRVWKCRQISIQRFYFTKWKLRQIRRNRLVALTRTAEEKQVRNSLRWLKTFCVTQRRMHQNEQTVQRHYLGLLFSRWDKWVKRESQVRNQYLQLSHRLMCKKRLKTLRSAWDSVLYQRQSQRFAISQILKRKVILKWKIETVAQEFIGQNFKAWKEFLVLRWRKFWTAQMKTKCFKSLGKWAQQRRQIRRAVIVRKQYICAEIRLLAKQNRKALLFYVRNLVQTTFRTWCRRTREKNHSTAFKKDMFQLDLLESIINGFFIEFSSGRETIKGQDLLRFFRDFSLFDNHFTAADLIRKLGVEAYKATSPSGSIASSHSCTSSDNFRTEDVAWALMKSIRFEDFDSLVRSRLKSEQDISMLFDLARRRFELFNTMTPLKNLPDGYYCPEFLALMLKVDRVLRGTFEHLLKFSDRDDFRWPVPGDLLKYRKGSRKRSIAVGRFEVISVQTCIQFMKSVGWCPGMIPPAIARKICNSCAELVEEKRNGLMFGSLDLPSFLDVCSLVALHCEVEASNGEYGSALQVLMECIDPRLHALFESNGEECSDSVVHAEISNLLGSDSNSMTEMFSLVEDTEFAPFPKLSQAVLLAQSNSESESPICLEDLHDCPGRNESLGAPTWSPSQSKENSASNQISASALLPIKGAAGFGDKPTQKVLVPGCQVNLTPRGQHVQVSWLDENRSKK